MTDRDERKRASTDQTTHPPCRIRAADYCLIGTGRCAHNNRLGAPRLRRPACHRSLLPPEVGASCPQPLYQPPCCSAIAGVASQPRSRPGTPSAQAVRGRLPGGAAVLRWRRVISARRSCASRTRMPDAKSQAGDLEHAPRLARTADTLSLRRALATVAEVRAEALHAVACGRCKRGSCRGQYGRGRTVPGPRDPGHRREPARSGDGPSRWPGHGRIAARRSGRRRTSLSPPGAGPARQGARPASRSAGRRPG
jgi:hypothetical protein